MIQKILILCCIVVFCHGTNTSNLKLKQLLIFSRHNIRTPIRSDVLTRYSPKKWPVPNQRPGQLTTKGALMEGYMGQYFKQWFESEQIFQAECPSKDKVYVYANSMNRTVETAEAFVESAFKDCNMTVHHKYTNDEMETMFNPVICNTTDVFKNMVLNEINQKLDNYKLRVAYSALNKILDIKHSEICKYESICDLTDESNNNISFEVGREVWVYGPLYVGNSVLDSFLMRFYDGLPLNDIAWGQLTTPEQWKVITEISRRDQNIRYSTVAKDYGMQLLNYLIKIFHNYDEMPKFILIVGHDFNQNALIHTMGFKSFILPNHYELYPIGGKIVFQRWTDNTNDYLKMEYVYPTWTQIRNGTELSMDNPPQRVLLRFIWCDVDENGFCPWSEFINKVGLTQ